jgi:DNA polymerase-1
MADWALGIYYKLLPICISEGVLDVIYELDVPFMMALGEIELAGWAINPESLKAMEKTANEALSEIVPKLQEALLEVTAGYAETNNKGEVIVPAGVYGMGNFRGEPVALEIKTSKPFNWGSPQHQQWLFFRVLKVDTRNIARSKTTRLPSCGKDEIEKIIEAIPGDSSFVKLLKEKKKYDKILSTYVEGMLPFCREDTKKIHTNLNLVSTWRLSSKKPNLQNIPRADNDPLGIRAVFEAPVYNPNGDYSGLNVFTKPVSIITERKLSGYTFYIGSDYSQIELKVLAWFAQERRMMDILAHGGDLHSLVAKEVFKLDCAVEDVKKLHKPARYRSKKVNFGIVYGMTEYGLSADPLMGMNKAEAKTFIENYLNTYPGVRDYSKAMIAFARDNGYVETMFGHRRPIPEINHPNSFVRSKGENKAMNTPIQGSAADIIRLAMVNIQRERLTKAPYIKQVMQIHDEVQAECPVEYAIEGAKFIKEVMERPIEGFSEVMPIIAEPAVGKIWAHALDIQFDEHGVAYVKPKHEKKEATDVTFTEIEYALPLYKLAGIEVRG